jgi:type I restriction enzyme S subunit
MNAERLIELFHQVADAHEAVPRLRRFILDLAVRGKLVEQAPSDEPATELLMRISAEKLRLVKAGEIKQPKPTDPVTADERAFPPPQGWTWTRLADIAVCLDYMREPINGTERDKRIEGKSEDELFPYYGATQQQGWIDNYIFDEELVLLGEDGVPFFDPFRSKAYIISGRTWVNNHAHVFKGILISHPFLAQYLNVFDYTGRVVGATRSKLNQARAVDIPIPLPPLAEQKRIVAKVDELMGLLDRLEAAREAREGVRDRLTAASLTRLTAPSTDPAELPSHARFAVSNLDALTSRPDQIKRLRQSILNLAIRGKLVAQDQTEEPASELMKRISLERKRLIQAKAIKSSTFSPIEEHELPFAIPCNWLWTRLGTIGDWGSGSTPSRSNPDHFGGGITWLKSGELGDRFDLIGSEETLTEMAVQCGSFRRNKPGDVLIAMYGATIGKLAILAEEAVTNQAVCGCSPFSGVHNRYLFLFLLAQRSAFHASSEGGAQPNISKIKIVCTTFPLPPLAEQHRIVAKVDALMALCDQLETALATANSTRARLLESLLHEALAPAVPS